MLLTGESDSCDNNTEDKEDNGVDNIIYIAVFSTVGGILVAGVVGYIFYPKIHTHLQLKKHKDTGLTKISSSSSSSSSRDVDIELTPDFDVNTAAGRFVIRM